MQAKSTGALASGIYYLTADIGTPQKQGEVLDGCAINNHYWVLAAATTNVGYDLSVSDSTSSATKTYRNPVGRASPATIDLQAFPCP